MSKNGNNGYASDNSSFNEMEWKELLAIKSITIEYQDGEVTRFFVNNFYKYFQDLISDKSYLSHARYVIKTLQSIALSEYGEEDFRNLLLTPKYLIKVLNTMGKTKSFLKRRWILRHVIKYYIYLLNLHPLSPEKFTAFNLVDGYGKQPIHKKGTVSKNHPMIDLLLDYLTEKNQKWHKRACIQPRVFLKWLVSEGFFESLIEIDVNDISYEMLLEFRNHLYTKVKNNNMTIETAQTYMQTLKRWFSILKNKGEIGVNPASRLKNFNVKKTKAKKQKVIFTLEELKRFFETILADKDAFFWYMVFGVQATLGLRASEVLGIKREDVNIKTGEVYVYRKYHKDKTLPLSGLTWLLLKRYIELNPATPSDQLWANKLGNNLKYNTLLVKFHYFKDKAGIKSIKGASHNFRHLLLTELCYQEQDLRKLKVLADVESEKTLNTYIHSRPQEVYRAFQDDYKPTGVDIKWQ